MNDLQVFNNGEFGEIRTTLINGNPYFVASDIAKSLGYSNTRDAINRHCRWVVKHDIPHPQSENKTLEVNCIPEGDIYRLVANSELPAAEKFEAWVFDEVLPTIRKHGGYLTPAKLEEVLLNPDTLIQLATNLKMEQEKRMQLEKQIALDKPKTIFAEAVASSHTSILVGDLAKLIRQNGYEIGQNRLFDYLRDNGFLIKSGSSRNMPTQRYMEQGLFEIKETAISNPDGSIRVTKTPKVTGKGQVYFVNHFLG